MLLIGLHMTLVGSNMISMISRKKRDVRKNRGYRGVLENVKINKTAHLKIRGYPENPENHEVREKQDIRKIRARIRILGRTFVFIPMPYKSYENM